MLAGAEGACARRGKGWRRCWSCGKRGRLAHGCERLQAPICQTVTTPWPLLPDSGAALGVQQVCNLQIPFGSSSISQG